MLKMLNSYFTLICPAAVTLGKDPLPTKTVNKLIEGCIQMSFQTSLGLKWRNTENITL